MANNPGNSIEADLFKNRATPNSLVVRKLVKDADGKYVIQLVRCERSKVFLGAACMCRRDEEAVQRKVHIVPFEYSVLALKSIDEMRTTNDHNVKNQLIENTINDEFADDLPDLINY